MTNPDYVLDYAAMGERGKTPGSRHRPDCQRPFPANAIWREATDAEYARLPMCADCSYKDATELLSRLGQRHQRHVQEGEELTEAIKLALEVTEGVVSRTEAADLLGIHRTSLYQTYLKK